VVDSSSVEIQSRQNISCPLLFVECNDCGQPAEKSKKKNSETAQRTFCVKCKAKQMACFSQQCAGKQLEMFEHYQKKKNNKGDHVRLR
jgi:hypothetical protein